MKQSRRSFLTQSAALMAAGAWMAPRLGSAEAACGMRLSACDWSLQARGPEGLAIAKRVGLDGLEISAGEATDILTIADSACREAYKAQVKETGVIISSIAMGFLNGAPLATDPRGPVWLEQTIDAAADLQVKTILLAFFGKGDLREKTDLKQAEVDRVVERLKTAAPRAEKAGVVLGLENTLSGADNMKILDRVQSNQVKIYYDIGNSTYNGYDVPKEIRELKANICQIHFKDGGYMLGKGKVEMGPVRDAIQAIDYKGWLVLETAIPSKDRDADFMKNAAYVRDLMGMA